MIFAYLSFFVCLIFFSSLHLHSAGTSPHHWRVFYGLGVLTYTFCVVLIAVPIGIAPTFNMPSLNCTSRKKLSWGGDAALPSLHVLKASAYLFIFFLCVQVEESLAIHPASLFFPEDALM